MSDASPTSSAAPAPAARADRQRGSAYLRLVGLGALIGVPAALMAAGFLALSHQVEYWLWTDLPRALGASHPPWYLVITLPVVGAAVVLAARRLLPGDGGHPPLEGIGGVEPTPIAHGPGIALAAIGTLGFGAVLGPEAPLIALGSVTGLVAATIGKVGKRERAVLGSAGSFAAISALFGGPIVGGMMMVEGGVSLGGALLPMLLPGFVAAAIGYVLFVGLGNWGGLKSQGLTEPGLPPYNGTHISNLLLAIAVGVIAALAIAGVRGLAARIETDGVRSIGMPALLLWGGLAVGLLAQTADWLGADSQDVLFSGQAAVPALVAQSTTGIVLILLAAKALTYAISLGCGYRGGPIFPAIYLGIAVATLPVVWFGASPTLAVAIGTAAGMSATTRLVLTPIVFAALLTGSHGVDAVPAAVLATVAAWLTTTALDRRSSARA
jgi:H+/Cl- antiporter ClcA